MDAEKMDALLGDLGHRRISRRRFLKAAIGLGVSMPTALGLLQACAPAPTVVPTSVPAETGLAATPSTTAAKKTSAVIGLEAPARGLDPFFISSMADVPLENTIYDSLFELDFETTQLKPILVEEWEQVDDLTWTFKLKEGVQFHKGYGEMTAEDWAFWANKIIAEKGAPYFVMGSGAVQDAVVTSKYTFDVHLSYPWAAFPLTSLVTYGGWVLSKKAYEEMGPEEFAVNPIGTGAFEIESWTPGGEVVMKRNVDYHDSTLPKLEELVFQGIPDLVVRLEKIRNGEIDWTYGLDMKDIPELHQDPNVQVLEGSGWNWDYITFNLSLADRPWLDKRVRQAVSYAIDREAIVQAVHYGFATPDDDTLPVGFLAADPDQQFYPNTADPDTALRLLAEAGYSDGFTMPCLTSDAADLRRELQIVADQLGEVGITVEIEETDGATYRTRWQNLEWETILEDINLMAPDPDAASYWHYHTSPAGTKNMGNDGYSNPEVDALLERARASSDPGERGTLYRQVMQDVAEDAPKVIICNINEAYVLNAGLSGFYPAPNRTFPLFKTMGWSA